MAKRQTKRGISREEFEHRMDFMELKLDQIERKLQDKADEIVAIELLQHRREIDDLSEAIDRIDQQLRRIPLRVRQPLLQNVVQKIPGLFKRPRPGVAREGFEVLQHETGFAASDCPGQRPLN